MKAVLAVFVFSLFLISSVSAASYYVSSSEGDDSNPGTKSLPWETIAKVNSMSFQPGDFVRFKAGDSWREQLNVPNSGTSGNPITFSSYGDGNKPKIISTDIVSNWELYNKENNIWRASVSVDYSYGILNDEGNDRSHYYQYFISNFENWEGGRFCGTRDDGYVYLRSDEGNPGPREVGIREHGIDLQNNDYIIIDGFEIDGPAGQIGERQSVFNHASVSLISSHDVIVRNCDIKYGGAGIVVMMNGSRDNLIENNNVDKCAVGIYLLKDTGYSIVRGNHITDTSRVDQDMGDRNAIGANCDRSYSTDYIIEYNVVERQGPLSDFGTGSPDDAIKYSSCRNTIIRYNYVKDVANVCLGNGGNADPDNGYAYVYGNICDHFGTYPVQDDRFAGIAIGGTSKENFSDLRVYNNLVINGKGGSSDSYGIILLHAIYQSILLANNLLYDNEGYELSYSLKTGSTSSHNPSTFQIKNNLFYHPVKMNIIFNSGAGEFNSGGTKSDNPLIDYNGYREGILDNQFFQTEPLIDLHNFHLKAGSPAIDSGIDVGLASDFNGVAIPWGSAPDIGPYEYTSATIPTCSGGQITSACQCGETSYSSGYCCSGVWQTSTCSQSQCGPSDTDYDGAVSITELMSYISLWESGNVAIGELMTAIGEWKSVC